MVVPMTSSTWYREAVGGDSENAVATRARISQRTLNRRLKTGGNLPPDMVVAIADAYGKGVIASLIETGLITEAHIQAYGVTIALENATARELADEVWRRMECGEDVPDAPSFVMDDEDDPGDELPHETAPNR